MMLVQYLLDHDIHIEIPGVGVAREMSSAAKNPAAPKAAGGSL